jgi:hypothetical protein
MHESYKAAQHSSEETAMLLTLADRIRLHHADWLRPGQIIAADQSLIGLGEETDDAIYLAATDNQIKGFIPSAALVSALRKRGTGEALTFDEEYSIETLWHEIQHARTRLASAGLPSETVIQFAARHSYPQLAEVIGVTVSKQEEIITCGHGYRHEVNLLRAMLGHLRVDEREAASVFHEIIETGSEHSVAWQAAKWLSEETGVGHLQIRKAMRQFRLHGDPGWRRILRDLAYGRNDHGIPED